MSRLVRPVPEATPGTARGGAQIEGYAERVAKYVPSEVIAAYLTANGVIASLADRPTLRLWLFGAMFFVCFALTPVYLNLVAQPGDAKRLHIAVSMIAFIVWAYSLGGLFTELRLYIPAVGSLLLIVFTLVSGAIVPREPASRATAG